MSNPLWNWFSDFFVPIFRDAFRVLMGFCKLALAVFRAIFRNWHTVFVGFMGLLVWMLNELTTSINNLDLQALSKPAGTMIQYFAFMNRFVPLSEAFAGILVIFNIWLFVTSIRWLKSFIPTISN